MIGPAPVPVSTFPACGPVPLIQAGRERTRLETMDRPENRYRIVSARPCGPHFLSFKTLEEMACFLMATYVEFDFKNSTASAWKRTGKTWAPVWPRMVAA